MSTLFRKTLIGLVAVLAFSAVAASTASAHRVWSYNGVELKVGEAKPIKVVKVVENFRLKAGTTTITCTKVALTGGAIENITGPTGRDKGKVDFTGCSNGTCKVTEPIVVKGETTALVENTGKSKIYDLFTPKGWTEEKPTVNGEFAEIKQTGTGCITATKVEGNGVAAEISPEGNSTTKVLTFPCPRITEIINWKGTTVKLKLTAFGVNAEECGQVEIGVEAPNTFDVK